MVTRSRRAKISTLGTRLSLFTERWVNDKQYFFKLTTGLAQKLKEMDASVNGREVALTGAQLIAIEIVLQ